MQLCAPLDNSYLTVKYRPRKAVLAFVNEDNGSLQFDIDTYEDNDIDDKLFEFMPFPNKPNKRNVAYITENTSNDTLNYYIEKMIEGMSRFE